MHVFFYCCTRQHLAMIGRRVVPNQYIAQHQQLSALIEALQAAAYQALASPAART
jgi:hypothetical protein